MGPFYQYVNSFGNKSHLFYTISNKHYSQQPKGENNPNVYQGMNDTQNVVYPYNVGYSLAFKWKKILTHMLQHG